MHYYGHHVVRNAIAQLLAYKRELPYGQPCALLSLACKFAY